MEKYFSKRRFSKQYLDKYSATCTHWHPRWEQDKGKSWFKKQAYKQKLEQKLSLKAKWGTLEDTPLYHHPFWLGPHHKICRHSTLYQADTYCTDDKHSGAITARTFKVAPTTLVSAHCKAYVNCCMSCSVFLQMTEPDLSHLGTYLNA